MNKGVAHYYEFGEFRFDLTKRQLSRAGAAVALTPKAVEMLIALLARRGQVVEKDELLELLWPDSIVEEANLTVNMSALRKALGESATHHSYIATVPGRGYKFVAEVNEVAEEDRETGRGGEGARGRQGDATNASLSPAKTFPRLPVPLSPRLLLAGLALLVVIALGLRYVVFSPEPAARRIVPLTSYPGLKQQPAFSPDGAQIAFVWNGEQEDNSDIYLRQTNAEGLLRLTSDPAAEANPVWSPDGRYIAFLRAHAAGSGIYLIPSLGGPERKLTDARTSDYWQNLDWSPSGKDLVVSDKSSSEGPFGLLLIAVESGERRPLTLPPAPNLGDGVPHFSPDGKLVAFVRGASFFVGDIYVVPVAGGEAKRLTFDNRWLMGLTWTADSQEIVFSSNRGGLLSLWRVSVAGGAPQALPAAGEDALFPAISRQGNHLAYTRWKTDSNIWRIAGPQAEEKDRSPVKLIASTRDDALPQYSPDGQRIAFQSTRSGGEEVWLSDSEGRNQIQLTSLKGAPGGAPRWSPDGRRIVFDGRLEGHGDIFVINVEGGIPRRLTSEASEDILPSWSRDGHWIYFTSNRSGGQQVWKIPAEGGPAIQITQQGGFEAFESPDGKYLYYHKANAIWRVAAQGGEETRLVEGVHWGCWAVTERGICFLNRSATPRFAIEMFHFATQQISQLANVEKDPNIISPPGFAVSPDGRWILFKRIDQSDNDILLVENFK